MTKQEEFSKPDSCFNRAYPDERMFVLLERDETAPATIRFWVSERIRLRKNKLADPQIQEALSCALTMELYGPQMHKLRQMRENKNADKATS